MPLVRRNPRSPRRAQHEPADRLLVVMPTWLGDTVMATPTLRALRALYPEAQITALIRRTMRPILDACPWVDRIVTYRKGRKESQSGKRTGPIKLARRLAAAKFDTAVLLPNSFRTALLVRMAGVRRRVGYDRDGRGGLLTDRLLPRRLPGGYVPVPTREVYLGLTRYLGAVDPDPTMQLFTRPADDARADTLLAEAGWRSGAQTDANRPLVLLNPGASFGEAKIWLPHRFAEVADELVDRFGAAVAITGAPNERLILDAVIAAAHHPIIDLPKLGVDLTLLKSVVRRASLMVTNDTGPRHMAAAFNVPVVTVFGPTDPTWSEIDFAHERQVYVDVYCRPCQKKKCPLRNTPDDHQCMTKIDAPMVVSRAAELLAGSRDAANANVDATPSAAARAR